MNTLPPFVDIHTHQPASSNADVIELCSFMVGALPLKVQAEMISVGIHPYQLQNSQKERLLSLLDADLQHPGIRALGEAGLDRSIAVSLEIQQEIFEQQAVMAERLQIPLVIHAVRTYDLLLQIHKKIQPTVPWIIHGFSAALPTAMQLEQKGFYLSVGAALFDVKRPIAQSLKELPLDKLFFETDDAAISIQEIYAKAADILGLDIGVLRRQIFTNFALCFKK